MALWHVAYDADGEGEVSEVKNNRTFPHMLHMLDTVTVRNETLTTQRPDSS